MAERKSEPEIIISSTEALESFAAMATHEDKAVRLFAEIFAKRVDLGALKFDRDPKSGQFVICGKVLKNCDPPIWMGMKHIPDNSHDSDALLLFDHKSMDVKSKANYELVVHGRQAAEGGTPNMRHAFMRQPDSLHVTSEWIEGALMLLSGVSREVRLGLPNRGTKQI